MTVARRLVPGQTHAFTRRTAQQCRFLQPAEVVNAIVLYALGRALEQNPGVALHAYLASTTHEHGLATDRARPDMPSALPAALGQKNALTARALNSHYGRGEAFWRDGSYDNVEVHGRAALEAQLLYLWTNPVKDGLVARPEDWPGVKFLPEDFGKTIVAARPEGAFFGGRRPDHVEPTHPAALEEWREALREEERLALAAARDRDRWRGRADQRQRQLEQVRRRRRRRARERERLRPRRQRSTLPELVTFTIARPPGYDDMTLDEVRAHFRGLLDAEVARIHAERAAAGKTEFMGVDAILAQDPRKGAGDTFPRFKLNPRVACKGRRQRIAVLRGLAAWRKEVAEKRAD